MYIILQKLHNSYSFYDMYIYYTHMSYTSEVNCIELYWI